MDESYEQLLRDISQNIKNHRKNKKLTQEQMRDFNFNYRHYQKIESGNHAPSIQTLFRVAQVFGIPIQDLFKKPENPDT